MQCPVKKGKKNIWNPEESSDWLLYFFLCIGIYAGCLNNKKSWADEIGDRYERPNSDICPNRDTFLAGSNYFQVSEFEVYQVPERKL